MFFINFIILLIGLGIVTPKLAMNIGTIALIYPWPNFLYFIELSGPALTGWYIFIVAAIIISIAWLIKMEGREFYEIFISSAKKLQPPPLKFKNSFVMIFQFFFALIFFNFVIVLIMALWGMTPSEPVDLEDPVLWQLLFDLANASVAEEIFTRMVYIGIPLLVFDFIARRPRNKLHRYFVGGGFKIEAVTIFLIIFSSVLFGLAHYPGWGLWKVFPTTAAGLAFGYLFVRKGIHTAIVLHFLFDYLSMLQIFFWNDPITLLMVTLVIGLMTLFWLVSGSIYFSLYIMKIVEAINVRLFGKPSQPQPMATAAAAGAPAAPWWPAPTTYHPASGHTMTQYPQDTTTKPPKEADAEGPERYCSRCNNKLQYSPYANSYYCESCLRYEF